MTPRADRGLTLIELMAAMAILAIVSLMAVQTLSASLFQRDILARADAQAADLTRTLALLRRDLEAVVPVPLGVEGAGDPEDEQSLPALLVDDSGFSLMRSGLGQAPGQFGRVEWRLDAQGTLSRRVTIGAEPGPWVPGLAEASTLRLTGAGGALPDAANPLALPPGFELSFVQARHGAIRLVVAR